MTDEPIVAEKQCCVCGLTKIAADFNRDRKTSTGLSPQCRACRSAWRKKNAEKISEYNADYRAGLRRPRSEVLACRECGSTTNKFTAGQNWCLPCRRDSYRAKREEINRARRLRYQERRGAVRATAREYYRQNPDIYLAAANRRRAQKKSVVCGCVTAEHERQIRANKCVYCGSPAEHVDHIMPLAHGGRHCLENLAPACLPCNMAKGAKILENPPVSTFFCTGVDTD